MGEAVSQKGSWRCHTRNLHLLESLQLLSEACTRDARVNVEAPVATGHTQWIWRQQVHEAAQPNSQQLIL